MSSAHDNNDMGGSPPPNTSPVRARRASLKAQEAAGAKARSERLREATASAATAASAELAAEAKAVEEAAAAAISAVADAKAAEDAAAKVVEDSFPFDISTINRGTCVATGCTRPCVIEFTTENARLLPYCGVACSKKPTNEGAPSLAQQAQLSRPSSAGPPGGGPAYEQLAQQSSLAHQASALAQQSLAQPCLRSIGEVSSALSQGAISHHDALRALITSSDADTRMGIKMVMDDIKESIRDAVRDEATVTKSKLSTSLAPGGDTSAQWRNSRSHATRTLHLTDISTRHTLQLDLATGVQVADLPATKPMQQSEPYILMYVLIHFGSASRTKLLMTAADTDILMLWVTERLHLGSKVEAVECTIRHLLFDYDSEDCSLSMADLVRTRAEFLLQTETARFRSTQPSEAKTSNSRGRGSSTAPPRSSQAGFCFQWTKNLPCAARSMQNGVCKFSHICGKDLGGGIICREPHREGDHSG